VATDAIISGLAVLNAVRKTMADGNAAEADARESGARCPGTCETGALWGAPGVSASKRTAVRVVSAELGAATTIAAGLAAPGVAYAVNGIVAAVRSGTAISPGAAAASIDPVG
jgi:hypothetical protein